MNEDTYIVSDEHDAWCLAGLIAERRTLGVPCHVVFINCHISTMMAAVMLIEMAKPNPCFLSVDIAQCDGVISGLIHGLAGSKGLQELSFEGIPDDEILHGIAECLTLCHQLKSIALQLCIDNESLEDDREAVLRLPGWNHLLDGLRVSTSLECVQVFHDEGCCDSLLKEPVVSSIFNGIRRIQNLRVLSLSECVLSFNTMQCITELCLSETPLKGLCLDRSQIDPDGFVAFAKKLPSMKNLLSLYFDEAYIPHSHKRVLDALSDALVDNEERIGNASILSIDTSVPNGAYFSNLNSIGFRGRPHHEMTDTEWGTMLKNILQSDDESSTSALYDFLRYHPSCWCHAPKPVNNEMKEASSSVMKMHSTMTTQFSWHPVGAFCVDPQAAH